MSTSTVKKIDGEYEYEYEYGENSDGEYEYEYEYCKLMASTSMSTRVGQKA